MKYKDYASIGERVYEEKLENGLQIFVIPKKEFCKTEVHFAANYGGADRFFTVDGVPFETPAGVAHFLEHKMFDMPDYNALSKLTENGARANAFTSGDMTDYHFDCTDNFYDSYRVLLDYVSTPYFTEESVAKEQGIIGQEIRMTEDNPSYPLYYGLLKLLYKNNPVRDSVAGTVESIAEITTETLYKCHKKFYAPSNMAICVVGNADPEKVADIAREMLSAERMPIPERDYRNDSLRPENVRTESTMAVGMPMFMMGSKSSFPVSGKELQNSLQTGSLAMSVLMGKGSPLHSELYGSGLINSSFEYGYEAIAGTSYLLFGGESAHPDRVCSEILDAAATFIAKGPDMALLERRKKAAIGKELRGLNVFDNVCYNILYGYFKGYDALNDLKVLSEITENDIVEFVKDGFSLEKMAVSIVNAAAQP